ncbi:MAG: UDP-N-acetylglucosamine 2-epimerase (non-hydrolyzing) [Planctomycetes bacterium]|nr:UDP-N-acetylglucosamine 2-epimerase (non-hydrolyzing) [Planctomycetota bacterium]
MKKIKVITVVGTRPEIIRLSRVIACLDHKSEHVLVHTGQNYAYELNDVFFSDLGIRNPDYYLGAGEGTLAETIGNIITRIDPILEKETPDALLVLGDTNSSLAVIPTKRRHIPIFHMEAGNRCFDQRVPEEMNRVIVDHVADVNMPYSDIAREYLLREGLPPDRIIKTGSPMYEVLNHYSPHIQASDILERLKLKPMDYFLVSAHREENVDSEINLGKLVNVLNELAVTYGKRIIVSTHPRTRKRFLIKDVDFHRLVELHDPLGYFDFVKLQTDAFAVLSDSGTITEESSILNFPALNIREAHERPEGMEEAPVIMAGLNIERIHQSLEAMEKQPRGPERLFNLVEDYQKPNVSEKVFRIIISYIDYIQRTVWYVQY